MQPYTTLLLRFCLFRGQSVDSLSSPSSSSPFFSCRCSVHLFALHARGESISAKKTKIPHTAPSSHPPKSFASFQRLGPFLTLPFYSFSFYSSLLSPFFFYPFFTLLILSLSPHIPPFNLPFHFQSQPLLSGFLLPSSSFSLLPLSHLSTDRSIITMDKLFTASSPFSQANYSPLRNPHEQDQDDDDPTSRPPHRSPAHLHHHANSQPQQFRHRSHSQSSSRAAIAYSSPDHQHPTGSFSEGEHDSDSETPLTPFNNTSNSNKRVSSGSVRNSPSMDRSGGISSGAARRISGLRPQSLGSTGTAGIMLQGETIIAVNNTPASMIGGILPLSAMDSSSSSDDEPSSPPPKYTAEDLEYSEPAGRPSRHYHRDEEVGLGFHGLEDGQGDGLLMQVTTTKKMASPLCQTVAQKRVGEGQGYNNGGWA